MYALLLSLSLFLGQVTSVYPTSNLSAQPTTSSSAAQTDPATSAPAVAKDSLVSQFSNLTIGKLFKGEKKLSPEELGHVEFWVALIKEPLLAVVGFIPRLFVAGVFVLLFWGINRALRKILLGSMSHANVDPSIRDMLGHLIKWCVMGFGLVIAFNQIGIQITALLTGVSIVGLAMGLAAQETLANFIAGIVIFWDKPFRIGDCIEIDGVCGTVQRVTFRSTRMLDGDGLIIVLPNTFVLAHRLANQSAHSLRRVHVPIGIAYKESIDDARQIMLGSLRSDPRVCADPAPSVIVNNCADSRVELVLLFWITDKSIAAAIRFEYVEKIKNAFQSAGIEIPFPHMQLLVDAPARAEIGLRAAG